MAGKVYVQASLSVVVDGPHHSHYAYGSGFRRAGLELVRQIYTGTSPTFGHEKITATEKLGEAWTGESIQSLWRPVVGPQELLLLVTSSMPSKADVVKLLQALGCKVFEHILIGLRIAGSPYIVGDGRAATYRLRLRLNGKTEDEAEYPAHGRWVVVGRRRPGI